MFESEIYLAVNKPVRKHSDELLTRGAEDSWALVHRLDFETSGCLLFCRPDRLEAVRALFKARHPSLEKSYLAGASSQLDYLPFEAEGFVGGRYRSSKKVRFDEKVRNLRSFHGVQAIGHRVEELAPGEMPPSGWSPFTYRVHLHTGARHQIRVWFAWAQAALRGDELYEGPPAPRLELHAERLTWKDPVDGIRHEVFAPIR